MKTFVFSQFYIHCTSMAIFSSVFLLWKAEKKEEIFTEMKCVNSEITFVNNHIFCRRKGVKYRKTKIIVHLHINYIFTFSIFIVEKVNFQVKFSKWRFWWIYTFRGPLNPKITFLAFGLCVCVSVCPRKCNQHHSKTNYSRNIKFAILHLYYYRCYLKLFIKIGEKLCVQGHAKES